MPMTMADLEDAQMRARERWGQFQQETQARWYAPLRNTMVAAMWRGLDAGTRDQLRVMTPAAAQEMDKRYGGSDGNEV